LYLQSQPATWHNTLANKRRTKKGTKLTAVSEVESLRNLLREQGLGSALPTPAAKTHPPASTGFTALDALLGGGIPRGQITELIGPASSGRTSIAFAILAEATARGEVAAYIDASDSLDPRSAQKAGIALQRLLWVRCSKVSGVRCEVSGKSMVSGVRCQVSGERQVPGIRGQVAGRSKIRPADTRRTPGTPDTHHLTPGTMLSPDTSHLTPDTLLFPNTLSSPAWQAVNLVASAGGFGVIVLDLGGVTKHKLREWQGRQWLRLRRAIEHSPTVLLLLASEHLASSVSALVLEIAREKTRWQGAPDVSLWLSGISAKVRVAHQRKNANRC
jgi:recombination protein RecA